MEPLDPELAHLDKAITEALDFKDEVARVLANRDDSADVPPPTDEDDHGGDDDNDDDCCQFDFDDDLTINVPAHVLGRAAVTVTVVVAKR